MEEGVEEIEAPTQQFSEYDTSDCVQMNSLMKRPLMI
jgi:hypothetical protein